MRYKQKHRFYPPFLADRIRWDQRQNPHIQVTGTAPLTIRFKNSLHKHKAKQSSAYLECQTAKTREDVRTCCWRWRRGREQWGPAQESWELSTTAQPSCQYGHPDPTHPWDASKAWGGWLGTDTAQGSPARRSSYVFPKSWAEDWARGKKQTARLWVLLKGGVSRHGH